MPLSLSRSDAGFDLASGLLRAEHFQMAYATNDMDSARTLFRDRLGIREFRRVEGENPSGGYVEAELAWVGTIMYELISASGPGSEIYVGRLPAGEGFQLRHHHLGYLVQNLAQWEAVTKEAERNGWAIPYRNSNSMMQSCFVNVPELGHYLEYLFPVQAGIDFFENVPRF